ncbi:helix-turn-helix domain-containing protein [Maribacter algarum]|uniref:Helix-turn-helix domain-containing protein n=1 Tax=Maribacter algarum (ex Zhang et al. 2020) TaxID=2578118 RepID=A0A5S3PMX1_9FLAO|nr:helix-turn-helix domain-containing protein [Maribacter algarum]TMM55812.1 helix-turn-helix domain-containing protein [Maribacter algarum]
MVHTTDFEISTAKVNPKESLSFWNDYVCDTLIGLDISHSSPKTNFYGSLIGHQLDEMHVCRINSQSSGVHRTKGQIAKSTEGYFMINFQVSGECFLSQDGRHVHLKPNDWAFTDSTRPYQLNFLNDFEQLVLKIPRKLITYGTSYVTSNTAKLLDDEGLGKILKNFVYSLSAELKIVDQYTRKYLAASLLQLLNDYLNLKFITEKSSTPSKETMLFQIKCFVEEHISSSQLTIQQIADTFKCSKRQLHNIFSKEDCTINSYIKESRLQKCRADIENRNLFQLTIAEIGYRNGFNDVSNFAKSFKHKFGIPPGEYRTFHMKSVQLI